MLIDKDNKDEGSNSIHELSPSPEPTISTFNIYPELPADLQTEVNHAPIQVTPSVAHNIGTTRFFIGEGINAKMPSTTAPEPQPSIPLEPPPQKSVDQILAEGMVPPEGRRAGVDINPAADREGSAATPKVPPASSVEVLNFHKPAPAMRGKQERVIDGVPLRDVLQRKLEEYNARFKENDFNLDAKYKATILDTLLKGPTNREECKTLLQERAGSHFNQKLFDRAYAVVADYVKTGGRNLKKGTGLKAHVSQVKAEKAETSAAQAKAPSAAQEQPDAPAAPKGLRENSAQPSTAAEKSETPKSAESIARSPETREEQVLKNEKTPERAKGTILENIEKARQILEDPELRRAIEQLQQAEKEKQKGWLQKLKNIRATIVNGLRKFGAFAKKHPLSAAGIGIAAGGSLVALGPAAIISTSTYGLATAVGFAGYAIDRYIRKVMKRETEAEEEEEEESPEEKARKKGYTLIPKEKQARLRSGFLIVGWKMDSGSVKIFGWRYNPVMKKRACADVKFSDIKRLKLLSEDQDLYRLFEEKEKRNLRDGAPDKKAAPKDKQKIIPATESVPTAKPLPETVEPWVPSEPPERVEPPAPKEGPWILPK